MKTVARPDAQLQFPERDLLVAAADRDMVRVPLRRLL